MHVVLQRVLRGLLGRLEERADIDVEADVGEGRRDHLGAAVVPILTELDHQDAGPAALGLGEERGLAADGLEGVVLRIGRAVDAGDRAHGRPVAGERGLHRVRDLAHRRTRADGLDGEREQVAVPACAFGQPFERGLAGRLVPPGATWAMRAICASRTAWLSTSSRAGMSSESDW